MYLLLACNVPSPSADTSPETFYTPEAPGPYTPGVITRDFVDARGKALRIEVWYPAEAGGSPDAYEEIPFLGDAVRHAHPAEGPFPLVAFSHGFGGIRYQSLFLTERLATHGFVVVAPDHPHNTLLDLDDSYTAQVALERPGDVMSAVDEVLRLSATGDESLGGLLDGDTYGMMGHSFGGWTTTAVAGGVTDLAAMQAFCAENDDYDLCTIEFPDDAVVEPGPDPRAVAAMPMAPAGWYSFGDLSGVPSSLLFGGTKDAGESPEREILPLNERLPTPKRMAVLADAGHYAFSDICRIGDIVDDCAEEAGGYIELDRAHTLINTLATAFFMVELRQDERYAEWLGPIGPEVDWHEQL